MSAAGAARDEYMIWSAHYTATAHICGPSTCGSTVQADATQWTSTYEGVSLDASLCFGYFFAGPPSFASAAAPAPAPASAAAPAPAAPASVPDSHWPASLVLQQGATGNAVKVLQQYLHDAGKLGERGLEAIDGVFGPRTEAAVRDFQQGAKIAADGIAGPQTRAKLGLP